MDSSERRPGLGDEKAMIILAGAFKNLSGCWEYFYSQGKAKILSREGYGNQKLMVLPCPSLSLRRPPILFPLSASLSAAL